MNQKEYLVKKKELKFENEEIELMKNIVRPNKPYKIRDKIIKRIPYQSNIIVIP
jgi:hypothetical protein